MVYPYLISKWNARQDLNLLIPRSVVVFDEEETLE